MRNDKRLKRKVRRSYIVSTISISLVIFLMGTVGYMLSAAITTAHTLRSSITLSAELDNSIGEERRTQIEQLIGSFEGVESVGICGATSTPRWLMEEVANHVNKSF